MGKVLSSSLSLLMKYNICTNFYSNYLYRCLPQYYSLEKTSRNFVWWVLCMDDKAYEIITKLKLKHARPIKLSEIENHDLEKVKKSRNKGEYSWTLKPFLIDFLFTNHKYIKNILYLDGDIFFFEDIALVFEDIGPKSIAIAPHRFPKSLKGREEQTGVFNAGVIYFNRDNVAHKCLKRWKRQCLDWCYWRLEDGKLGDQMYLNEWPKLYKNLHQFKHKGINLAPWNVNEFKLTNMKGKIFIDGQPLIFYHFHQFKVMNNLTFDRSFGYKLDTIVVKSIYKPYEAEVMKIIRKIKRVDAGFSEGLEKSNASRTLLSFLSSYLLNAKWKLKTLSD